MSKVSDFAACSDSGHQFMYLKEIKRDKCRGVTYILKRKNLITHETFCNNNNLTYLYFLNGKGTGFPFEKMVTFTVLILLLLAGVGTAQNGNYF